MKNRMHDNSLAGTPFLSTKSVNFNVQNSQPAKGPESYQIIIEHNFSKKIKTYNKSQVEINLEKRNIEKNRDITTQTSDNSNFIALSDLDWLFLDEKESLVLFIDGERLAFKGKYGKVGYGESIVYDVSRQQLEKIASARNVRVKIITEKEFERHFSKRNFVNLKEFLEKY